ncbi:Proteasome subunit beta [Thalictrum thalictroides]|uniref:Proteasome subunit beta n=1 Tax=Thalictrum thalictroides TaxID=46969 RepID=A0A7J6W7J2_THATH|nr:Proteasome subunit beta [Thalictrum thalictroides]
MLPRLWGSIKLALHRGSYGSTLRYKSVERMKSIGKHSLLGGSGEISDFQKILRYIDELMFPRLVYILRTIMLQLYLEITLHDQSSGTNGRRI